MKIVVLSGGVGGAKFLLGVKEALGWEPFAARPQDALDTVTAIVNTADDIRLHGLQICPDLDSCMYTLSGSSDLHRGWGQRDETWTVSAELAAYGEPGGWFSLGDKDIATHVVRSRLLAEGMSLSAVTDRLCERRPTGVHLLPMTDNTVTTTVLVEPGSLTDAGEGLHFQEWWVRHRAEPTPTAFRADGALETSPAPGALSAIAEADVILLAPSNPVVSIGPILAIPGYREALRQAHAPVVGVSPIVKGAPLRGHADVCLAAIGVPCTAEGVGIHYGARTEDGLLDGFLVAPGDGFTLPGVRVREAPLIMTDPAATAAMVDECLRIAGISPRADRR